MSKFSLKAISPIDGRYKNKVEPLSEYFSEWALFKYRLKIEVEYFIALCELPLPQLKSFDSSKYDSLRELYRNFDVEQAQEIKEIEKVTNHDVKAVEYFLKAYFEKLGLGEFQEFIHFGLTSQDINNTATPLLLKESLEEIYKPALGGIVDQLSKIGKKWADVPMLARTHGQPASPTKMGREILIFYDRIVAQESLLKTIPNSAKFGGATGNFNAHYAAYPEIDWMKFADELVNNTLGLHRSQHTTQIEHYDNMAAVFDNLKRINTILIDFCRDMWTYISMDYFRQELKEGEVGSSTMPHKVNPIDFENAEGNLGIANSLFEHLSAKLPISRLQRDLTDSTVLRNIGVPFGHTIIALSSIQKGIDKLMINEPAMQLDLDRNWVVITEAIQTVLRREGYPKPYEVMKKLTRKNTKLTKEAVESLIEELDVEDEVKQELKRITPYNYTGVSDI
ncbi:MAG: adenylosuccinate lyase [Bacteroidetes bacterium]|nr:adenylosuccinate lyase [Bacteroidota bacterium]